MNTFHLYDMATGEFMDRRIACPGSPADMLADAMRFDPNAAFIMGEYDHLSQRVDLDTGNVVDYVPPSPGPKYAWDAAIKRWAYVPGAAEALWNATQAAMARVNLFYGEQLSGIRATYPNDEVASWSKQESEARAWTADHAAPTPLLSAISASRGVPFALLVEKVIEKADLFAAASGALIGARQQAEDRINAAATPADVAQIMAEIFPGEITAPPGP